MAGRPTLSKQFPTPRQNKGTLHFYQPVTEAGYLLLFLLIKDSVPTWLSGEQAWKEYRQSDGKSNLNVHLLNFSSEWDYYMFLCCVQQLWSLLQTDTYRKALGVERRKNDGQTLIAPMKTS